jgi:CyaY protein
VACVGKLSGPFCPQPAHTRPAASQTPNAGSVIEKGRRCAATLAVLLLVIRSILAAAMSIPPLATPLSDADYHRATAAVLAAIEATVDRWLQQDVVDIDSGRTGGLLELSFPGGSKIVINTQPPLQELWVAARAGGYHFRHADGRWIDRDGQELFALLSQRASEQAGQPLRFEAP